jgi:hypothetical protein
LDEQLEEVKEQANERGAKLSRSRRASPTWRQSYKVLGEPQTPNEALHRTRRA